MRVVVSTRELHDPEWRAPGRALGLMQVDDDAAVPLIVTSPDQTDCGLKGRRASGVQRPFFLQVVVARLYLTGFSRLSADVTPVALVAGQM